MACQRASACCALPFDRDEKNHPLLSRHLRWRPILARWGGAGAATTNSKIQPNKKRAPPGAPSLFIVYRLSLEVVSVRAVKPARLQAAVLEISGQNRRDINQSLPSFSRSSSRRPRTVRKAASYLGLRRETRDTALAAANVLLLVLKIALHGSSP